MPHTARQEISCPAVCDQTQVAALDAQNVDSLLHIQNAKFFTCQALNMKQGSISKEILI
jgi:hypothetical protein